MSRFELGKERILRDGSDMTIVACGVEVSRALDGAELLVQEGTSAQVIATKVCLIMNQQHWPSSTESHQQKLRGNENLHHCLLTLLLESARPARMTYEQFLAWADEDTLVEWVKGEVLMTSPASVRARRTNHLPGGG